MARWLEKFVNHEMFALYMSQGYNLVHGYVVDARAIGRTDRSRALFEGLYLDEEVGSDARVGDIATLRFPLWPTDEVISAMGGHHAQGAGDHGRAVPRAPALPR